MADKNTLLQVSLSDLDGNTTGIVGAPIVMSGSMAIDTAFGPVSVAFPPGSSGLEPYLTAIQETGTRQLGLTTTGNSSLSTISGNTASLTGDLAAIRIAGTRSEGLTSVSNTELSAIRISGTRQEDIATAIRDMGTKIWQQTYNTVYNTAGVWTNQVATNWWLNVLDYSGTQQRTALEAVRQSGTRQEQLITQTNTILNGTVSVAIRQQPGQSITVTVAPPDETLDANGRTRTSDQQVTFESKLLYDLQTGTWDQLVYGGAGNSVAHNANECCADLTVAATQGCRVIRQTYKPMIYVPGSSLLVVMTGIMNTSPKTGCRCRIGMFDDTADKSVDSGGDGAFFELNGTNWNVVQRSTATGTQSDNTIAQANWNIDPMNGTGPSGISIDASKIQIFVIDLQWLGASTVRMGFKYDGKTYFCHKFHTANRSDKVYWRRGGLPLRYEIFNTSATSGTSVMKQVCSAAFLEGGVDTSMNQIGKTFCADGGAVETTLSGVWTPIQSMRVRSDRCRILAIPDWANFCVSSAVQTTGFAVIMDGTTSGGSWSNVGGDSAVEINYTPTSYTGGVRVASTYTTKVLGDAYLEVKDVYAGANIRGRTQEIVLVGIGVTGNSKVTASLRWREI